MKKEVTIIRCDGNGCQNYVEWEKGKTPIADVTLPTGWYVVKQVADDGKTPSRGFDFCSLRCVGRWAKGRNGSTVGERSGYAKKACPSCGEMFAPQGFQQHWIASHNDEMPYEEAKQLFSLTLDS